MQQRLGIVSVTEMVRRGRLRWFGHVERKGFKDWVANCREIEVDGVKGRGRGRKTWMECVQEDMSRFGLTRVEAQDRDGWRVAIHRKPSKPC